MIPGSSETDERYVLDALRRFPQIERAILFGSRAKGGYKASSDIDLALYGADVDLDVLSGLKALLEEVGPLPHRFDLIGATHLSHKELAAHIERVGIIIYDRRGSGE